MGSPVRSGVAAVKNKTRHAVIRLGREEQARQALERLREVTATFNTAMRRERRDEHGTHLVLATVLRRESNAIDVGANMGAVLESIVRIAPGGRHLAFEPIPELYERLAINFPGVDVHRAALSDVAGTTEFSHVRDASSYSGLRERADLPHGSGEVERIQVQTERLDDLLEPEYVPTLIKIDVEGAEFQVLSGAVATLERHRPFVLFEHGVGGADLYGTHPNQVFDLLDAVNLRIFDLDGSGPYTRERFESTFTQPVWNFLAAPS
jgi:FkbM family methyltransferase